MNSLEFISADAVVVGTGAAGYNAACRIAREGARSVVLVTEGVTCGTSRNTGSDKQTYYKLGLGGDQPDSVRAMAGDLFAPGAVDGDNALCEAALSTRCFLNLCELGVPFPVNRYGEYIGYKTDHDPFARATSAGPLTSRFMTEALQRQAEEQKIPVYDGLLAIRILKEKGAVCGLLCLRKKTGAFVAFWCGNVVLATGGPAGIYADSVYPLGHHGSTSLALSAGARLQNMTEWQYGLASVAPRWNVSGTYMQVLPRFISVDETGTEREFLLDVYPDAYAALSAVFLKGYQWPFDCRKARNGSSVIDLAVYREQVLKKRRVYLDYSENPFGMVSVDYDQLQPEARDYLRRADACFGTPIERLEKMNAPAVTLYREKGVDLHAERLEIALCAQHNNGGIAVDLWWQTAVPGLFAVGECAGTHGVTRPGGSALNAGQVGSLRAAQYISARGRPLPPKEIVVRRANEAIEWETTFCQAVLNHDGKRASEEIRAAQRRMSDSGGAIRDAETMETLLGQTRTRYSLLSRSISVSCPEELYQAYQLRDILLCQEACLTAMVNFSRKVGATRGSALYTDLRGQAPVGLEDGFRFRLEAASSAGWIQEISLGEGGCQASWRPVRPLPQEEEFFENVWRAYRENQNIF